MKAKNLALAGVAALGAVALLGVFAVQANSHSGSLVLANPTTKSQLFDHDLAKTYWPEGSENNWKTIKRTSNADNDMLVRVVGGRNFGKYPNFCESQEYAASTLYDRSVDIIVGANNIQSFTFNFHFVMWGDPSYTFGYRTTVRWYEADYFNIDDPDSSADSRETEYTNDEKLVQDEPYSISWEKTSGSDKYRYLRAHFGFTCKEGSYPIVFLMDNFTVTWSC